MSNNFAGQNDFSTQLISVLDDIRQNNGKVKEILNNNDLVKVMHGPLEGSEGKIISINKQTGVVNIETVFFGRATTVDVDFSEIEKI
jgi:transcription antitermination factor NusG